jgi:uncharacterized protein YndB with AHSA1/START domain
MTQDLKQEEKLVQASVEVTTPSDREVTVTRTFAAPARLVFDCHTKPEYVQRWLLGPPGWSMPVCEIDLKVGGSYRYVWRNDDSGAEFGMRGTFMEISAPERIVHTESMDGAEGEALCTSTFVEREGQTTLSVTIRFASKEMRDHVLQTGMTDGMAASYDRLEELMNKKAG